MKKAIKIPITILSIILMMSFTNIDTYNFIGNYGVPDSDQIILSIHSDHTFYYKDLTTPKKQIIIKGIWLVKRGKLVLDENSSGNKFHNVWSFYENGKVAKSRKGLNFYRLCKID